MSCKLSMLSSKKKLKPSDRVTKAALENHKAHLEEFNTNKRTQPGYFFVRAPLSPFGNNSRKMAGLVTDSAPACLDKDKFNKALTTESNKFRPAKPKTFTPRGGVASVETPKGTELYLTVDLGVLRVFSSDAPRVKDRSTKRKIKDYSPSVVVITPPPNAKKTISQHFTTEFLAEREEDIAKQKKLGKNPTRNQAKILSRPGYAVKLASMNQLASAYGIAEEDEQFEWLHLICFEMMRHLGQIKENLVGGTFHSNTLMIPVESYLPKLCNYFPGDISLHVSADLDPKTHNAKSIHYAIIIKQPAGLPPIIIPFEFDALLDKAPSRRIKIVIDIFMQQLMEDSAHELDTLFQLLKDLPESDLAYYAVYLANQKLDQTRSHHQATTPLMHRTKRMKMDSLTPDISQEELSFSDIPSTTDIEEENKENSIPMPMPFFRPKANNGSSQCAMPKPIALRTRGKI